jgi:hypothetical protein
VPITTRGRADDAPRELLGDELPLFEPHAEFDGDDLSAFHARRHDFFRQNGIGKKRAPLAVFINFRHGTTHVNIHHRKGRKRLIFTRFAHNHGFTAKNLRRANPLRAVGM